MEEAPKKKPVSVKTVVMITAAAVVIVLAGCFGVGYYAYAREGKQYTEVFFPNTTVNGLDASNKTVEEIEKLVSADVDSYVLTIEGRGGVTEQITGAEIGLHNEFDGSLEQYLAAQDPMQWWDHREQSTAYEVTAAAVYDKDLLQARIDDLIFFSEEVARPPKDAYLSGYTEGEGFVVVPEEQGALLDKEIVRQAVFEAVENRSTRLVLEDLDAYQKPAVTSEDEALNAEAERLNRFGGIRIVYQFDDQKEVLDAYTLVGWLKEDADGRLELDRDAVTDFVAGLAERYDTVGKPKTLHTSYGTTAVIEKGTYGWQIDQEEEAAQLYDLLLRGESQTREPVYIQRANSHGDPDFGDSYVEINMITQHVFLYVDGELVTETDCVTGKVSNGNSTPEGIYPLAWKQKNRVLRGPGYASFVNFWMPFNGGVGMHDASWRSTFGGTIYKYSGSHGCVNMPYAAAQTIYEHIEAGFPVICYNQEESAESIAMAGKKPGESVPEEPGTEEPAPEETLAAEPGTEAAAPEETTEAEPETEAPAPEETTASEPGTEASVPEETAAPTPEETLAPETKTEAPAQGETSASEPGTETEAPEPGTEAAAPEETLAPEPGAEAAAPEETTVPEPGTEASVPEETTATEPETEAPAPEETTASEPETEASIPADSSAPAAENLAPETEASAPGSLPEDLSLPRPDAESDAPGGPGETG